MLNSPQGAYLLSDNASIRIVSPTFGSGVHSLLLCIAPLNLYPMLKLILLCVNSFLNFTGIHPPVTF